ncbi:hypothetical protein BDR04DRAFT_1118400 [Suillus decipiens]|nr:hypothetical protein BDR04DRAFT_1118400 [Suillus decipiens]
MTFGEVLHYVTQPTGWPEPVRGIASLLSPFHCPDRPSSEHLARSYTAKDFQILIQSTAAGLNALAELPYYGGKRSTVPLWSQLLHALANTLSTDVIILEDAPFIMPRARNVASQPLNFIDGHATLLAAHAIFSAPRTHSDISRSSSRNKEDEDESMYSVDSDSCDGSVDSLDLPLQAYMLPGRGRRLSAVVPVLLVADSRNIVPLLCSTLYQRHVWRIRQPVVGLCCSSSGTIAKAIFGWLDSDQSEEGLMATADIGLDASMGVFDFTDTYSAISLAQFVLGLRTHFEDIKGATSIEAVDFLNPLHWRSDLPDFETQSGGQSDERVKSWTHQSEFQRSFSEASSSSSPHTPPPLCDTAPVTMSSPLLATIVENEQVPGANIRVPQEAHATDVKGQGKVLQPPSSKKSSKSSTSSHASSPYPNSQFAALSDTGLNDNVTISNWLFERNAFTVGRIPVNSDGLAKETGINTMVKIYDEMTAFTWSDKIKTILLDAEVDSFVSDIRSDLCGMNDGLSSQSSANDVPSWEDAEFIASKISLLLHIVKGARQRENIAKSHGANKADRRHEWNALLLNFFQPVPDQRHVLLERQLNFARNLAVDDSSFALRAIENADAYDTLCTEQFRCVRLTTETSGSWEQAAAARFQVVQFSEDIRRNSLKGNFAQVIAYHSSMDPATGKCDAILVIPYSGNQAMPTTETILSKDPSCDESNQQDLLLPVLLAKYKKDESAIFTAMNQMRTYLVSAVTFLSEFGLTDKPIFGLVVDGTLGAITMAWKTNNQIYIMERNVRYYDIRDPLQALQFVLILLRLTRYGLSLRRALDQQLAIIDAGELQSKPWSKLYQRQEDERLAAARRTEAQQEIADEDRR